MPTIYQSIYVHITDPINDVIDVNDLELLPGEIGEIILSGTHINTKQVIIIAM